MLFDLKRGWLLLAVVLGLLVQFSQFFRSQILVLGTFSDQPSVGVDGSPVRSAGPPVVVGNGQPKSGFVNVGKALDQQRALEWARTTPPLAKPGKFNYSQPAIPTAFTLPPPNRTNQSTIVIVLSARDNFEKRTAIRESWGKGNDNVYFIIGGPNPGDTDDMDMEDALSTSYLLFREQQFFGDIIDAIHPDTYRSLPYKLHFAMRWIMRNLVNVHWIVKADDDQVVRVKLLQHFVLHKMNPFHPQVIGTVAVGAKPHKSGKWAEDPMYKEPEYPPWAFGSAGYVVSRPVAQYLADQDYLYYYQGEDAGLGIWMMQSPIQVTWIDSPELRKDEGCQPKLYIIGHDLSPERIRTCFSLLGDDIPERPYILAYSAGRKDQFPKQIK